MTRWRESRVAAIVRCPDDATPLQPTPGTSEAFECSRCGAAYPIEKGIVRLVGRSLHPETEYERQVRDREAIVSGPPEDGPDDFMGVSATMDALDLDPRHDVLEVGAGTGRFTRRLIGRCASVMAVDISAASLEVISHTTPVDAPLLLVQADATAPVPARESFDRVLGTLVSNLPDAASRGRCYRVAASALRPEGRFVFSAHHFGLRARLNGEERDGRYEANGLYRRFFTPAEIRKELEPCFGRVRIRPISVSLPLAPRLGRRFDAFNRGAERIPGLRAFGQLLLVDARVPLPQVSC